MSMTYSLSLMLSGMAVDAPVSSALERLLSVQLEVQSVGLNCRSKAAGRVQESGG
jgi:hypothetical protein